MPLLLSCPAGLPREVPAAEASSRPRCEASVAPKFKTNPPQKRRRRALTCKAELARVAQPRARRKLRDATQRPDLQRPEQPPGRAARALLFI